MRTEEINDLLQDNPDRLRKCFRGDVKQISWFMARIMLDTTWPAVEAMRYLTTRLQQLRVAYDAGALDLAYNTGKMATSPGKKDNKRDEKSTHDATRGRSVVETTGRKKTGRRPSDRKG